MQVGIMATDGGKHSDEYFAISVAKDIVVIGATASKKNADEGLRLQVKLVDILEPYFKAVSEFEHGGIDEKGTAHLASPMDVHPEIRDEAIKKVLAALDESTFKSWFTSDQARDYVTKSVGKFIGYAQHMHRDWFARWGKVGEHLDLKPHAKHDPDCPHVQRWQDMHDGSGSVETITAARAEHNDIVNSAAA